MLYSELITGFQISGVMNDDVVSAAPRPRPLSGGLWTILSWLRREERDSSSESLSSAGSDRTVASFAFLKPANYSVNNTNIVLPALGPPTDSYKKRVYERNVRRQYERDLTLHRKYGLYRSEGVTGYDTFTLQQYQRTDSGSLGKWSRERRAVSEGVQRRSVHVPGKRRAPLPPTYASSTGGSVALAKRTRKRRAPQPPADAIQQSKESTKFNNILSEMNSLNYSEPSVPKSDTSADCKFEKYVKKDTAIKDMKCKQEKSFLRQIFENRKKNSTTDTASIKILPSISELDKQAAEIIETGRLKAAQQNRINVEEAIKNKTSPDDKTIIESWFCTKCLKKYDVSVKECNYCFPKLKVEPVTNLIAYPKNEIYTQTDNGLVHPSTSKHHKIEDKQKLKEILKEMKDSLPKRPKHDKNCIAQTQNNTFQEHIVEKRSIVSETPTLRIGSTDITESSYDELSSSDVHKDKNVIGIQITHFKTPNIEHVKLDQAENSNNKVKSIMDNAKATKPLIKLLHRKASHGIISEKVNIDKHHDISKIASSSNSKRDLHTPLRISALLNPMYIPKNKDSNNRTSKEPLSTGIRNLDIKINTTNKNDILSSTGVVLDSITSNITSPESDIQMKNIKSDTKIFKPETNQSLSQPRSTMIKDEVKVDVTKSIMEPKSSISLNIDKTALKDEPRKAILLQSYRKENKPSNSSNPVLPTTSKVSNNTSILSSNVEKVNQHVRRRELVNQLEKSIAKGDESAAADAAVKLAQLRLSCSVLSFSSQIVTESLSLPLETPMKINPTVSEEKETATNSIKRINGNKNKDSQVHPQIVNKVKASQPAPINLSINKVNSFQDVKETATSTANHQSKKSELPNKAKDPVITTTARAEIKPLEEKGNINNVS